MLSSLQDSQDFSHQLACFSLQNRTFLDLF